MDANTKYRVKDIADRHTDTLIGLCKGMLAGGELTAQDATALHAWLIQANCSLSTPIIRVMLRNVERVGTSDLVRMTKLVRMFAGMKSETGEKATASGLPLDQPEPPVTFAGRRFVLTGTFAYGARDEVTHAIEQRGGVVANTVTLKTDYLVTGAYVTDSWKHETFGRKIEKAMEYRRRGKPLKIVSEENWMRALTPQKEAVEESALAASGPHPGIMMLNQANPGIMMLAQKQRPTLRVVR